MSRRFALDQNFPVPILNALRDYVGDAELVSVRDTDARLMTVEDWELLLWLHQRGEWDGLVTTDSGMLTLPHELSILVQTKLTLVVAEATGHDPLKATGLVLTHLPRICQLTTPQKAQVWALRATTQGHRDPWEHLALIAKRAGKATGEIFAHHRLSSADLRRDPLQPRTRSS